MAYPSPSTPPKVPTPQAAPSAVRKSGSGMKGLVTFILLLVIIGGGVYALANPAMFGNQPLTLNAEWQAVFLSNGQVYFGKVTSADSQYVRLESIYYLQVVNQPLQRSAEGEVPEGTPQEQEQRLTLIKLGNEIHGPFDAMTINRAHVVLIEDLKNDSRVVQAIQDYITGGQQQ